MSKSIITKFLNNSKEKNETRTVEEIIAAKDRSEARKLLAAHAGMIVISVAAIVYAAKLTKDASAIETPDQDATI